MKNKFISELIKLRLNILRVIILVVFYFQGGCFLSYSEQSIDSTSTPNSDPVIAPTTNVMPAPTTMPTQTPSPNPTSTSLPSVDFAVLSDLPNLISTNGFLNVTVGGSKVVNYKYKLGYAGATFCDFTYDYSSEIDISQSINTSLGIYNDGYLILCVIAKNNLGNWQSPAQATAYQWYKSSLVPSDIPQFFINGPSVTLTQGSSVVLSLLENNTGYTEMYLTNQPNCVTGGTWEPLLSPKDWILDANQAGQMATVYVKFRTASLIESACINDSVAWNFVGDVCTPLINNLKSGILYDDGGLSANYGPSKSCSFDLNNINPIRIHIKQIGLKNADLSFWDNTDYYSISNVSPSTETLVYNGTNNTYENLQLQNQNYDFVLSDGPVTIDFYSNFERDSGFEISWIENNTTFTPISMREKSILINNNQLSTSNNLVTLDVLAPHLQEMYITNTLGCTSGGSWEPIVNLKNWTLSPSDGTKHIYYKFRSSTLFETACEVNSIQLDTTPPLAPMVVANGVSHSTQKLPPIWVLNAETNTAISKMEVRIIKASDQSVVSSWQTFSNGEVLSQQNLENGISYQFEVRIYDQVGWVSGTTQSLPWSMRPFIQLEEVTSSLITEGTSTVVLKAKFEGTNGGLIAVPYVVRGEAAYASDHNLSVGTLIFNTGENEKTLSFQILDDANPEPTERLVIELTDDDFDNPQFNYALNNFSRLEYLIHDNDGSYVSPNISKVHKNCVLLEGGLKCWGLTLGIGSFSNYYNTPTTVYPAGSGITSYEQGGELFDNFRCVIQNGGLNCWGSNSNGLFAKGTNYNAYPTPVPIYNSGSQITKFYLEQFICVIKNQGLYCWGRNSNGVVGDGTTVNKYSPYEVFPELSGVTDVISDGSTVCVIINSGLRCWGNGDGGQLANGTFNSSSTPVVVYPDGSQVTKVYIQESSIYALVNGELKAWGYNYNNSLGINIGDPKVSTPVTAFSDLGGTISDINSQCAIVDGGLYCWGSIYIGENLTQYYVVPTPVPLIPKNSLVTENVEGCAVVNGGVKCFKGFYGTEGDGVLESTRNQLVTIVPEGSGARGLSKDKYGNYCVIIQSDVKCWGHPYKNAWGNGLTPFTEVASWVIPENSGVTALARNSNCALKEGGVQCWGYPSSSNGSAWLDGSVGFKNSLLNIFKSGSQLTKLWGSGLTGCVSKSGGLKCWGQSGLGTVLLNPFQIEPDAIAISQVALASNTICYIKSGLLFCSNYANNYQFENKFPSFTNVTQLSNNNFSYSMSYNHSCLINNGGVYCWGGNSYGQLGDGTTVQSNSPVNPIAELSGATHIAAGGSFTCAVVNGGVYCWGNNIKGQIGNGTQTQQLIPVNIIPEGSLVTQVESGYEHACALFSDGAVKCWGEGTLGELGIGGVSDSTVPVNTISSGSGATHLYVSGSTSMAIVNGGLKYWGYNPNYGAGISSNYYILTPKVAFPEGSGITPEKFNHSGGLCAVINGGVQCMGNQSINSADLNSINYGIVWLNSTW